ncbi:MAG: pyridoxal 5'-phosphate synthase glutaminase subunit PdxT [Actinomycetota bacterium]|nr:pyridoxal 5'-phosphate synthase glutaminase subunit PdxT [Actinomycetota bacterium]
MTGIKVGVLALQGAAQRHADALTALGAHPVLVRRTDELAGIDALVIPGGESTTMSRLLVSSDLFEPLADRIGGGIAVFGTCAGMILLASEILDGREDQRSFGAIDLSVRRNGFGRQVDSFETNLDVTGLAGGAFPATFIRAPLVERAGPDVEVLATVDGKPVLCRCGSVLVSSFHPELSGDLRLHQQFLSEA